VLAADTERAGLMAEAEHATDPHRIAEIQAPAGRHRRLVGRGRASTILKGLGFDAEDQQLMP
jgi:ATP-binding cassette subfamily F protein 3